MTRPWYTAAQAAEILQTTTVKVYELVRKPGFPTEHLCWLGKEVRISPAYFEPPPPAVVVEDELTLARVRKGIDLVQQELDLVRKLVERSTPLERMG